MGSSGSVRRDGAFAVEWLPADASEKQQVGYLTLLGDVAKKPWGHLRLRVGMRSRGQRVDLCRSQARAGAQMLVDVQDVYGEGRC